MRFRITSCILALSIANLCAFAQQATLSSPAAPTSAAATSSVPQLVRFSGVAKDGAGNPLSGIVGITFALYRETSGGAPLWLETQSVNLDSTGHYSVQLGVTLPGGLPLDLFASGEARWLGVQIAGQPEQPRTLLLSVPYALKAGDSATLGGLPASAFMLAAPATAGTTISTPASAIALANPSAPPPPSSDVTTTGGTVNAIPLFSTATNIQNSILTQAGTSTLNVGGRLNLPAQAAATASTGKNSRPQDFVASAFNSSTSTAVPQTFQWQAEPAGNDTATASGTLNLLFGQGTAAVAETGLLIASNGQITFAAGQAFPGTGSGTITSVEAGTGLSGGGTSGNVTLNNTGVLGISVGTGISSSGGQNPTLTNTGVLAVTPGTGISVTGTTNPTVAVNTSTIPQLSANNSFTGNNSFSSTTGNTVSATTSLAGASGLVGLNTTTASTSGSNGVWGSTFSSGGAGTVGYNQATVGTAYGIYGQSKSSTGIGVYGTGAQDGVYGSSSAGTGVYGQSASGSGVVGQSSATTGSGDNGVYGSAESPSSVGVVGVNFSTGGHGVYGQTNGTSSNNPAGVYGTATSSSATVPTYGVYGTSSGIFAGSAGVYGVNSSSSGSQTYGVYGQNQDNKNFKGIAVAGTGSTISATGSAQSALGSYGAWGDGVSSVAGVLATADTGVALLAENNDSASDVPAMLVVNESNTTGALAFQTGETEAGCTIDVFGNLNCSGTITQLVSSADKQKLEVYGVASTENWIEDFGTGQLSSGVSKVMLDPGFSKTVSTSSEYHVFLTPKGDCEGLYVTNQTPAGFEVRELRSGRSSTAFDYRIVAKRRGYDNVRLEDITASVNARVQRGEQLQAKRVNVGETSAPARPVPIEVQPVEAHITQPAPLNSPFVREHK